MISELVSDRFELPSLCRYFSERSPQPMVVVEGQEHVVRYLNPAFARLAGMTTEELVGRSFAKAVSNRSGDDCLAALDRVFRSGLPENLAEQEHGQTPPSYWSYVMWAILGEDERPVGVMIQVTEATEVGVFRRRAMEMNEALMVSSVRQHELVDAIQRGEQDRHSMEVQLFQAQKLESLGVLAGGIAHDLNNMLTPIIGFAELASSSLPRGSSAAPLLDEVRKTACRAADLVQQILAYAGKGRTVIEPVDLSDLVREMSGLLGLAVSINVELGYDLASALPFVEADATQLRQVVMNLVTNASEAISPDGGTVTVRTGSIPTDDTLPSSHPEADPAGGPSVFLEVADSGCGMTSDIIERIFEPFFTTKFTGRGLSLAVVQGIAQSHRGALEVRSEPGKGSTFRFLLPRSTQAAVVPVVTPKSESWRGSGTVLVIDDEDGIRRLAAIILEQAGLTVLVAGDGQEGSRVFREHQQKIDVVVIDLTMPGMSGLEVAGAFRGLRPDLSVILMSGFSVSEVTLPSTGPGITSFVQKPFNPRDLLAAVRDALGHEREG